MKFEARVDCNLKWEVPIFNTLFALVFTSQTSLTLILAVLVKSNSFAPVLLANKDLPKSTSKPLDINFPVVKVVGYVELTVKLFSRTNSEPATP